MVGTEITRSALDLWFLKAASDGLLIVNGNCPVKGRDFVREEADLKPNESKRIRISLRPGDA